MTATTTAAATRPLPLWYCAQIQHVYTKGKQTMAHGSENFSLAYDNIQAFLIIKS
jgi:hypothetical protein